MSIWTNEKGACAICIATILTVVMIIAVSGTIHYTIKRQEQERAAQLSAQAQTASEREVIAVSRIFASISGGLVQSDLFRIQEMLQTGFVQEGLAEAVVLDLDNMIVAAKDPAKIGQHVRDISWMSIRAKKQEVVSRGPEQSDHWLLTVVEPLNESDQTVAWARLTYSLAKPVVNLRTSAQRLKTTVILIGPLALLFFACTFGGLRWMEQHSHNGEAEPAFSGEDEEERKTPSVRRLKKAS